MPAIPAYIPFVLLSFFYIKIDVYYSEHSNGNFHLYFAPKEGYEVKVLYAEMETDIHTSNNSLHLNLDHARIFWDGNVKRNYFRFDEDMELMKTTTNGSEASIFSLATTPELVSNGQFKIHYTTAEVSQDSLLESNTVYEIVMQLNLGPGVTQHGPYQLSAIKTVADQTHLVFEVRGSFRTLPEIKS